MRSSESKVNIEEKKQIQAQFEEQTVQINTLKKILDEQTEQINKLQKTLDKHTRHLFPYGMPFTFEDKLRSIQMAVALKCHEPAKSPESLKSPESDSSCLSFLRHFLLSHCSPLEKKKSKKNSICSPLEKEIRKLKEKSKKNSIKIEQLEESIKYIENKYIETLEISPKRSYR